MSDENGQWSKIKMGAGSPGAGAASGHEVCKGAGGAKVRPAASSSWDCGWWRGVWWVINKASSNHVPDFSCCSVHKRTLVIKQISLPVSAGALFNQAETSSGSLFLSFFFISVFGVYLSLFSCYHGIASSDSQAAALCLIILGNSLWINDIIK